MEAFTQFSPSSLVLFFLYTLVTLLVALVGRISVGNMGERAKNRAVEAVTVMVSDTVKKNTELSEKLLDETQKRSKLEGNVDALMTQVTEEKRRSDNAYEKLAKQNTEIEQLSREVRDLTSDIKLIRDRLTKVEAEKRLLEEEKAKLLDDFNTQGEEYRKLMDSIQERINKAVADVREELRVNYEGRISKLEQQIQERDAEIGRLQTLLKEKESHENSEQPVGSAGSDVPAQPDKRDDSTGSNGKPDPSADTGNRDGQSGGGSPSA